MCYYVRATRSIDNVLAQLDIFRPYITDVNRKLSYIGVRATSKVDIMLTRKICEIRFSTIINRVRLLMSWGYFE